MAQGRDGSGRFGEKMRDQDLLKVFDYADDPMLTAKEVANGLSTHFGISVSTEAVRNRLRQMEAEGRVASKEFGARAVGWQALVAPAVTEDVENTLDERTDAGEFVPLD